MSSLDPWRKLVKYVVRAFYDEEIPARDASSKSKVDKADNRGIAVVVLDALSRRQWMKEDELARQLSLHPKQLRRTLRALQEERLVVREQRKENAKTVSQARKAVAAETGEEAPAAPLEKWKQHEYSYCALDYGQMHDVIRYRLLKAKKKLKDELEDRNPNQGYICPTETCRSRFTALDAGRLLNPLDYLLHCERCGAELVEETAQLAGDDSLLGGGGEGGGAEAAAAGDVPVLQDDRRSRRDRLRKMQERMEKQLEPLAAQFERVKALSTPLYRTLAEWEATASASTRASAMGYDHPGLAQRAGHAGASSASPMPSVGETQVEVNIGNQTASAGPASEKSTEHKPMPAWAVRASMNLTAAQRGAGASLASDEKDVKPDAGKPEAEGGLSAEEAAEKERIRAYYEAYRAECLRAKEETAAASGEGGPSAPALNVKDEVKEEAAGQGEDDDMDGEVEWDDEDTETAGYAASQDTEGVGGSAEAGGAAEGGAGGGAGSSREGRRLSEQGTDSGVASSGVGVKREASVAFFDDEEVDWES